MSERLSVRTTKETLKRGAKVLAPVLAVVALASCAAPEESVQAQANARQDELAKTLDTESVPVLIMPGAIIADENVAIRKSPAKVDYNNAAMIEGNNNWEVDADSIALHRPFVIENNFQVYDDAPTYWVQGYSTLDGKGLTTFGINEETAPHLRYFVLPGQERASYCGDELTGLRSSVVRDNPTTEFSESGFTINAGSAERPLDVPVGLRITGGTSVEAKIHELEIQGYEEQPLCVDDIAA